MDYITSQDVLQKNIGMNSFQFFVSLLNKNVDICLFGFGKVGKAIYECMCTAGIMICCVCDNDWSKMGDKEVVSPEKAVRDNPNALFVIASHIHCYEMELQLLKLGVPEEKLISYNTSVMMAYRGLLPENAYREMVSMMHYEITGNYPNLESPSTFNEKVMALMIEPPTAAKIGLVDKFKVRSWIEKKIGRKYLVPLIGDWDKVEDIDWKELPLRFALKMNHGCGFNILSDGRTVVDFDIAERKLKDWIKCNFGYKLYERQYIPIKPHILCEEYIENRDDDIFDYKIFCFHGEPKYIMFLSNRKRGLKMLFLDLDWNVMPFVYSYPQMEFIPPKPEKLGEMIEITKALSKGFEQVRVDWYVLNDGRIKFGEMTFTSAAGHAKWNPIEWDLRLGKMW